MITQLTLLRKKAKKGNELFNRSFFVIDARMLRFSKHRLVSILDDIRHPICVSIAHSF